MDKYISRRELLARYDAEHEGTPGRARELIKQAPAADVAPVRHGRWIPSDYTGDCCYTCSECGFERDAYLLDVGNYCPECGTLMDGKEGEHEAG